MPMDCERGICYAETLFGSILNLSCLPKTVEGFVEYFESPLEAVSNNTYYIHYSRARYIVILQNKIIIFGVISGT